MGFFMVTLPGANERAIEAAGLVLEPDEDRSRAVVEVGGRMRAAATQSMSDIVEER